MPRFDKTGPKGMGPMTGRGMGICKSMPKKWMKEEMKEHGIKPCSMKWLNMERREGHKSMMGKKIDWAKWAKEEAKEYSHSK